MNIDIIREIKNVILNTSALSSTYSKNHKNTKYSLDLIISEIIYFLKSGVSWTHLRSPINTKTLYWHFSRFVKCNVFHRVFSIIRNKFLNKYIINDVNLCIDSTTIFNKYGHNKIGRNKFYKNKLSTKISLMTDTNGFPLSIFFMKGNYHDNRIFEQHVNDSIVLLPNRNKTILADKAYSSTDNYSLLNNNNIKHIIPPRSNMKIATEYKYDKNIYKKRIIIENIFARLKQFKRINNRYDKKLSSFSAFVCLAFCFIANGIATKLM